MTNFFNGIIFQKIMGVVLLLLAGFELVSSYKYTRSILQNGTSNVFSILAIAFAFFFGLVLFCGGIICLFYHF
ncbi:MULTISPECIES: hypothetical protein [Lactobacillus]|uniref:hypothetical protein n=1 Tax=Lactobacillus TaxID=1578 RepID=UPI00061B533C|nr:MULTISPECIES: hypothetical protein [Lactobacillus]RMC61601.1 hypothetical protein F5ESL0259_02365 [Lactobacillus sp. ESL0259]